MRIVGGALSGRTLPGKPPEGTRPTADRVREAIASALQARGLFEGAVVLDLFAGTGALGLEALSWGAKRLIAIDSSPAALRCVRENADALGLSSQVSTVKLELGRGALAEQLVRLARACDEPATLLLADPPYAQIGLLAPLLEALAGQLLEAPQILAEGAAILVEHAHKTSFDAPGGFVEIARYRYGDTAVLLGRRIALAPTE
jgi:16S rRNA (guanine966-N2)-methyltransferase